MHKRESRHERGWDFTKNLVRSRSRSNPGTRLSFETLEPRHVLSVVISEIMYHPSSGDVGDEYIELFNQGIQAVDLTGWKFNDGIDFTFTGGTLNPGQYLGGRR